MSSPVPVPVPAPATRVATEEAVRPPSAVASPGRPTTAPSSSTIRLPGTFPDLETNAFWEGPLSPGTVQSILDGYENLGPVQLRQLASGLTSTLQQREALFQDEARCLKRQFKEVNRDNRELKAQIQQINGEPLLCPNRYIENEGRLPEFTITTPDGKKPAVFIKQLDDGRVAGLAANVTGDHDTQIIELYARPEFDDYPLSPLPPWFRAHLWGTEIDYHPLCEAIINLDDWPLLAEVTRYRVLDRECDTLHAELRLAQANLAASEAAKQACEDRLIAARAAKKIPLAQTSLSSVGGEASLAFVLKPPSTPPPHLPCEMTVFEVLDLGWEMHRCQALFTLFPSLLSGLEISLVKLNLVGDDLDFLIIVPVALELCHELPVIKVVDGIFKGRIGLCGSPKLSIEPGGDGLQRVVRRIVWRGVEVNDMGVLLTLGMRVDPSNVPVWKLLHKASNSLCAIGEWDGEVGNLPLILDEAFRAFKETQLVSFGQLFISMSQLFDLLPVCMLPCIDGREEPPDDGGELGWGCIWGGGKDVLCTSRGKGEAPTIDGGEGDLSSLWGGV
ncbi:hypothetical protein BJV74DRAFT_890773 [Russula compacta]|nr:hypothetical protein BJV74DRAFT_890773 [Russula compacta]